MHPSQTIIDDSVSEYATALARDCDIDSTCVFIADKTTSETRLYYLGNYGVSHEVMERYRTRGICDVDPFTDTILIERSARDGDRRFYPANDPVIGKCAERLADYWRFVSQEDIEVVGAATMRLQPRLYLVVGAHRMKGRKGRGSVPMERLAYQMDVLQTRIAASLLTTLLAGGRGYRTLVNTVTANDEHPGDPTTSLSSRETEVARLVCEGKQNKEIAWLASLSECTVENHLRRIYKKLGIHNRAALVASMHGVLN